MKKIIVTLIALYTIQVAIGQEYFTYGFLPENTHNFALTTPDGWIYERFTGSTLFKKQVLTEGKDESAIHVSTLSCKHEDYPNFSEFVDYMIDNYKKHHGIQTTDANDIIIDEETTATCKFYTGESDFHSEKLHLSTQGILLCYFFCVQRVKRALITL